MPFIGAGFGDTGATPRGLGSYTEEDLAKGAENISTDRGALSTILGGGVALGALDLVDTVASSIPGLSGALGIEREDVNRGVLRLIDQPGLNDFYRDTRGASEVGSGILGVIGAELITNKLTKPASAFMRAASKLPYVRRVAALDRQYDLAMDTVRSVDVALARRGTLGSQQYRGIATVPVGKFDASTGAFTTVSQAIPRNTAVARTRLTGMARGVRHAATTEAVMAIGLNQNGFLYDDDMGHNLAWMALGLGIGGVAESAVTSYRIRKHANSDLVRREFAGALDPDGIETSRLLWHGSKVDIENQPGSFLGGVFTDKITSLMVDATTLREKPITLGGEGASTLASSREALATQKQKLAFEEAQKVSTKGISTDGRTRFSMNAPGYGNHLEMAMYRDPTVLNGVEMLGGVADDMSIHKLTQSHKVRLEEQREEVMERLVDDSLAPEEKDKLRLQLQRLEFESQLQPMALMDGELMPISEAEAFEGFMEPAIKFTPDRTSNVGHAGIWEVEAEAAAGRLSIDDSMTMHFPTGKSLDNVDHYDMLRMYRLGERAISKLKNSIDPIKLPENPNWFQLDMAEEILRQSQNRAKIVWPTGMTRESAQVESLVQKAQGIEKQKRVDGAARKKADGTYDGMLSRMRVRYNLPRLTAYERGVTNEVEHPVEAILRGIDKYGPDEVRNMTLPEIKEAVAKYKRLGDMVPVTGHDMDSLAGSSFKYMMDESGKPLKPLIMYKRAVSPELDWNVERLAERIAANKLTTLASLSGEESALMSRELSTALSTSPDFDQVARPHELLDTQIQGSIAGPSPQSTFGAFAKSLVTSEWRDRDSPILLAATRLRDTTDRLSRDFMKTIVDSNFGDKLSVLKNPRNAGTRLLLNQFHSYRSGWDLLKETSPRDGGFHAFVLAETPKNQARFQEQFGRKMAKGEILVSPQGKEVVLDDLGLDVQKAFNATADALVDEKNSLLKAVGRGGINKQAWYVPPPNTQGKFIGFLMGPDGKPTPGYTVIEATQEAFDRARASTIQAANEQLGLGYIFRTQDEIRDFADLWDKAQMDFVNPGMTAVQPGKSATGRTTGQEISLEAFEDSMKYLRNGFMNHGNDLMTTLLKDQIQSAKMRSHITSGASKNKAGFFREEKNRSVYDYYLENLLGTNKLNSAGTFWGGGFNWAEGKLDGLLAGTVEPGLKGAAAVWRATDSYVRQKLPGVESEAGRQDFKALANKLGEHMPFESAAKLAERQANIQTPVTVQKIGGELNRFTAAVVLRMMEVAHPIMNLAGMVNSMPSVIRHLRQLPGESGQDWASRVGHSAQIFHSKGANIAIPDMTKIASRAFKNAWSKERHADYDYMVRRGFLSQEVAEFQRQFGAIKSKGEWESFFYGDPSKEGFKSKGLVGWTGVLSDRSEDFSRSWGHMVGLEVADVLKIEGMEARHGFAHDIANKMIANYNPHNRPEILQGAMGAPIGLFQSFIFNYYQRLFRYAETGDYQSLATQYAVQGGLFGVTSLTGWDAMSSMFLSNSKGEDDIDAGIYSKMGGPAGDLLAGGALSNLPKLFGGEAVDLYSRGDTNVRLPGLGGGSVPAFNIVSKLWTGIGEAMDAFSANHPGMTPTQLSEIMSNAIANRPIAGMLEQLAGGYDTDSYGQVVTDTKTAMEMAYRMLGVRSMRQSKEVEAFYADKGAQEYQAAAKETLRSATRSAMRAGDFDRLPLIFEKYVETGGDPRYFRRWMKDNYEAATTPRTERRLEELMNNPANMDRVTRILDRGVGITEDEELGESSDLYPMGDPADELNQDTLSLGEYGNQITYEDME